MRVRIYFLLKIKVSLFEDFYEKEINVIICKTNFNGEVYYIIVGVHLAPQVPRDVKKYT